MNLWTDKIETSRAKRWAFQGLVLITVLVDLVVFSIALWSRSSVSSISESLASGHSAGDESTLKTIENFTLPMLELLSAVPALNLFVIFCFYAKQRKANVSCSSHLT